MNVRPWFAAMAEDVPIGAASLFQGIRQHGQVPKEAAIINRLGDWCQRARMTKPTTPKAGGS
jgi:hypothetical protein